jgi:hypothetical protein
VTDYRLRGDALDHYNIIEFFIDSYESKISSDTRYKTSNTTRSHQNDNDELSDLSRVPRRPGRPCHERVPYLSDHPKSKIAHRILRGKPHCTLPNFIGQYFPRRDDPDQYDFYCASMLMLLKPWRSIERDLKLPSQTWASAFETFLSTASQRNQHIVSGIQYFHNCLSSAQRDAIATSSSSSDPHLTEFMEATSGDLDLDEDNERDGGMLLTEEGLAYLLASQVPFREELHGRLAVEAAKLAKIFTESESEPAGSSGHPDLPPATTTDVDGNGASTETQPQALGIRNATENDIANILSWKQQMTQDVNKQNLRRVDVSQTTSAGISDRDNGYVTQLSGPGIANSDSGPSVSYSDSSETSEASLTAVDPSMLRYDQFRAYDIITWHLNQTLAGEKIPPLRMIIHGEGGTGKSKVIQTVTEYFAQRGVKHILLKAAYTGVAASLIDGKTTHTIGMMSQGNDSDGKELSVGAKAKLQALWKPIQYLIIDEISMIGKAFFAKLSRNIGIGKMVAGEPASPHSFGGVSVIKCGDFFQFPPVVSGETEALYFPAVATKQKHDSITGRLIYEESTTVVVLKEQMRVVDEGWRDFLQHLRFGQVQQHHIKMLRTLLLTNPNCLETDFNSALWTDAALITPRHAVRRLWNEAALRQHSHKTGRLIFQCHAEDTIKGEPLTLAERYAVATRGTVSKSGKKRRKDLPAMVEVSVGMKVMVTQNVETDLDITTGARGVVVDILLSPEEPAITVVEPIITLKHLPLCILVKLNRTRATQLKDLEESVIPVEPMARTFRINCNTREGKTMTRTVRRHQFPMTAAYGFTDYRAQGQTIPSVIVDIATPPTGALTLFNLYVALSRSSGRSTIRLLRDFEDKLFHKAHQPELLTENDRLEELNKKTLEWWRQMRRDTRNP